MPLVPSLSGTYLASCGLLIFHISWMGSAVAEFLIAVPNRMRALLTAILLFGTNIIGLTVGPSGVAALTQFVFQDPLALRYSLAIVSLVAGSLSIVALWFSLRNFAGLTRAGGEQLSAHPLESSQPLAMRAP